MLLLNNRGLATMIRRKLKTEFAPNVNYVFRPTHNNDTKRRLSVNITVDGLAVNASQFVNFNAIESFKVRGTLWPITMRLRESNRIQFNVNYDGEVDHRELMLINQDLALIDLIERLAVEVNQLRLAAIEQIRGV